MSMESNSDVLTVITIQRHRDEGGNSSVVSRVAHGLYADAHEVAIGILMAEHVVDEMKKKFFGVTEMQITQPNAEVLKQKGPNLTDPQGNRVSSED
jgi:hypothetical protein